MSYKLITLKPTSLTATLVSDGSAVSLASGAPLTADASAGFLNTDNGADGVFSNSNADFFLTYTFDGTEGPQYLSKILIDFNSSKVATDYLVQVSTDGTNYTTVATVSSNSTATDLEYLITQPNPNPIKYRSFRFKFTAFQNASTLEIDHISAFIPNNIEKYTYSTYNVEFDDALLDLEGWKKPRYEGSKLTGQAINTYNETDVTYGKNPVIESKVVALYIGNTLIGGDGEEDAYTEITNHSYATVDKILLIDLDDDSVQIIDRQNTNPIAFRRHVDRDLFEGSGVNVKLLDFSVENALKPRHAVKFNRGSLQKLYAYTANTGGFEDGVFGGFGSRTQSGEFLDNLTTGSDHKPMRGMFGYGSMFVNSSIPAATNVGGAASASLFTTGSIQFVESLPSELSAYAGDVNTATLGLQLNLITQSFDASAPTADAGFDLSFDTGDTSGGGAGAGSGGGNAPDGTK